jgi:Brp/Blh family beta-carotene 15,15'-monooxygenase
MAAVTRPATSARRALGRAFVAPSWAVVVVATVAFALGVDLSPRFRYLPLVASVAVFGLPHGAVDHLALPWVRGRDPTPRAMAGVGSLYLVVGGAYAVAWFLAPAPAFVAFVLLTWFHWGQGDLYSLVALTGGDHLPTRTQRALAVAVRGGLPMLVPLVAFPGRYRTVGDAIVGRFGGSAPGWLFTTETRIAFGVLFGSLAVSALVLGYVRTSDRRSWLVDAAETVALATYFAVVPPVVAIGLYFPLWHSTRHIARLLLADDGARAALDDGDVAASLGRFARQAAPLTAASLLLLVGLSLVVPANPTTVPGFVALYLVLIAVLTLPHVVVVTLMDREQAMWSPDVT